MSWGKMADLDLEGEEQKEEGRPLPPLEIKRGNVEVLTVALLNDISRKLDKIIELAEKANG